MKVRLEGPQCFVLTVASPKQSQSGLFYFAKFLCSWMPLEGIEIAQHWALKENSESMQLVEMKEVSSWLPRELKFVRRIFSLKDLGKLFYVVCDDYLPQGKGKLLVKDIFCLKTISCLRRHPLYLDWIAQSKYYVSITKKINFNCSRRWNHWKSWGKW